MPYRSSDSVQPTALYRLYSDSDQLLYIGITRSPEWRWYKHASHSPWWPQVQRREIAWHDSRPEARAAEIEAWNCADVPKRAVDFTGVGAGKRPSGATQPERRAVVARFASPQRGGRGSEKPDRKSTRLNSSHLGI